MSENMRERVAESLANEDGYDIGALKASRYDGADTWDDYMRRADAAIAAMSEPDAGAITAGVMVFVDHEMILTRRERVERIYRAMIGAAKGGP